MFFTMADVVDDGRGDGIADKKRRLDASYAAVGSEFKDKDWSASKTNRPVWEQEARDENGQRRFHGAFTGGFSAGYHNTVGSEEGWTPASFVSSRTSKAKRVEQTVDSFMDDEDRSEMFSEGLTATKKFNSLFTTADELASRNKNRMRAEKAGLATETDGSAPPALSALAPASVSGDVGLVTPTHKTIGMYLLKKMGWKRGASAPTKKEGAMTFGPKFTNEEIEERNEELFREGRINDPEDGDSDVDEYTHVVDVVPKNDHYGIGYNPSEAIPEYNEMKALRETLAPAGASTLDVRGKKKVPGSGLGLSVLEDDDDVDMYDREIGGTQREMKKQKNAYMQYAMERIREEEGKHLQEAKSSSAGSSDVLSGFVCEAKAPPRRKAWFKPPEVPKDYVPYHYFTESLGDTISPQLQRILTPQMRTFILGEDPLPRTPRDSVLSLLSIEDRSKFLGVGDKGNDKNGDKSMGKDGQQQQQQQKTADIRLPEAVLNAPTRVIYKGDPQKQRRFELFLDEQRKASKNGENSSSSSSFSSTIPAVPVSSLPPPDGLSPWAWEAEKLEFMSNAIMMKPVEGPLADTFAPSGSSYSATEKVVPVEVRKDAAQDRLDKAVERKMYGKLTRTEVRWNPNALLCKRFNVPRPRQNVPDGLEQDSASVALTKALPLDMFASPTQAGMAMMAGNDNSYNSLLDAIDEKKRMLRKDSEKVETVRKVDVKGGGGGSNDGDEDERDGRTEEMKMMKEQEEKNEEKPSIDLFKAIFENSDDDEVDDEEEEKEGEDKKKMGDGNENRAVDKGDKKSEISNAEQIVVKQDIKKEKGVDIEEEDEEDDEVISFGPEMPPVPLPPSFKEEVKEKKEDELNMPPSKKVRRDSKSDYSDSESGSSSSESSGSSGSDSDSDRKRHKRHRHKSSRHRHHSHHKHHKRHHSHKRHHHHHHH